jgi:putative ABC transport system permease protein
MSADRGTARVSTTVPIRTNSTSARGTPWSRTREIGIRVALGARRGDVIRMVLRQGMMLALAGMAIGLVLAAGASRLLGSLLFSIGPTDPIAFGGSAVLFCLIGLIACYVPARRATAVDATEALRYE